MHVWQWISTNSGAIGAISGAIVVITIIILFWQAKMLRKENRLNAFNSLKHGEMRRLEELEDLYLRNLNLLAI